MPHLEAPIDGVAGQPLLGDEAAQDDGQVVGVHEPAERSRRGSLLLGAREHEVEGDEPALALRLEGLSQPVLDLDGAVARWRS